MDESIESSAAAPPSDHGWQKVTYTKKRRNVTLPQQASQPITNGHVFASVEQKANDRHQALRAHNLAQQQADPPRLAKPSRADGSDADYDDSDDGAEVKPKNEPEKKPKVKKVKKPKVSVAEAAAKIDDGDLAAFLAEISGSYEVQQDIQLMRFADYFARAFAGVSAAQFPWAKLFKESPVAKIADIPLCHISESVYNTSVNWIAQKSPDALGNFVMWCLDTIFSDLSSQTAASKGSKKTIQQTPSKAQVAIFVVLAMVVKRKPDILISLLPKIKDDNKLLGQERLPVIVWVIAQAHQGDPVVGMYLWAHYLFPSVCGKSSVNPQSRDLVLQLVERILSGPKARSILLNGAVRKGERLVPPATLDLLIRTTFPSSTARIKATERFEAIYPTIKVLALAGSPGTKTTKQASQQILPCVVQAMKESNPELTNEASSVFIWCLIQNAECYKLWEKLYLDNLGASAAVLKKLSAEWKEYSGKISPDALRVTVKNLKAKNEKVLSEAADASKLASVKEADKYCKALSGKLSRSSGFQAVVMTLLVLAVAVYFAVVQEKSLELEKIRAYLSAYVGSFKT